MKTIRSMKTQSQTKNTKEDKEETITTVENVQVQLQKTEENKKIIDKETAHQGTMKSKEKNIKIKCDFCKKVYVKPSYFVKHMKKMHEDTFKKKTKNKKDIEDKIVEDDEEGEEDVENELSKETSVMLQAGEVEDDKEATEMSVEADKEETRLGINVEQVSLYLEDIQTYALPSAMEPVEFNDKPSNNKVMDLTSFANVELETFLATTIVHLTNEPLVEVPKSVSPSFNSAAAHFMNKSLTASQTRLLIPVAEYVDETEDDRDKEQSEKVDENEKEAEPNKLVENPLYMLRCRRCRFTADNLRKLVCHTKKHHTCQYKCRV